MGKITKGNIYHPCRRCHEPTQNLNNYCDNCQEFSYKSNWVKWHKEHKSKRTMLTSSSQWIRLRELVKKRDEYLCQECLRNGYLVCGSEVDHIIPVSQGGSDTLDNLQLLCTSCHRLKTLKESRK